MYAVLCYHGHALLFAHQASIEVEVAVRSAYDAGGEGALTLTPNPS